MRKRWMLAVGAGFFFLALVVDAFFSTTGLVLLTLAVAVVPFVLLGAVEGKGPLRSLRQDRR
ncbi:MAG: hypothetical protein AAGD35_13970 [Actinomycetota bacterium]